MIRTISYKDELLAIEHGVWILPKNHHDVLGNRRSINRFTGDSFYIGTIEWLTHKFSDMGISYEVLKECKIIETKNIK